MLAEGTKLSSRFFFIKRRWPFSAALIRSEALGFMIGVLFDNFLVQSPLMRSRQLRGGSDTPLNRRNASSYSRRACSNLSGVAS